MIKICLEIFNQELKAAGLLGLPFSYSEDGIFTFDDSISEEDKNAVLSIYDAHDYYAANFKKLKSEAIDSVKKFASKSRQKIAGYADQYKLAGWATKAEAARRVLSGSATAGEVAAIQIESDKRGESESVESLAQKIVDKANQLQQANGIIEGMESAAIAAIESKQKKSTLNELMKTLLIDAEAELQVLLSQ